MRTYKVGEKVMLNTMTITPIYQEVVEVGATYIVLSGTGGSRRRIQLRDAHKYIQRRKEDKDYGQPH